MTPVQAHQSTSATPGLAQLVLTGALFQAAWIGSAMSAAYGASWFGVLASAGVVAIHLWRSVNRVRALALVAAVALAGLVTETLLLRCGIIGLAAAAPAPVAPAWLVGLWAAFATLLPQVLRPLASRPLLAAVVGGVFAPLAYLAGQGLGALTLPSPVAWPLAVLAAVWAVALPLLLALQRRCG